MDYRASVIDGLKWCVSSRGRAPRRHFWLLLLLFAVLETLAAGLDSEPLLVVATIMLIPLIAVGARRLHDTGRHGAWMWLLLSLWGWIVLAVFLSGRSQPEANRYGPPPRRVRAVRQDPVVAPEAGV